MKHPIMSRVAQLATLSMFLAGVSGAAVATAVPYAFTTGVAPYGNGPVTAFSATDKVQGTFMYDSALARTQVQGNGAYIYNLSFTMLQGSVGAYNFNDAFGYTAVGNDVVLSAGAAPTDYLQLGADPTSAGSTKNIVGFDVPGYHLSNVRLFWIEGQTTPELIADYLSSQDMLASLPAFHGRLALDFTPTAGGATSFVFFDGLSVTPVPVPVPSTLALVAGAFAVTLLRRVREPEAA